MSTNYFCEHKICLFLYCSDETVAAAATDAITKLAGFPKGIVSCWEFVIFLDKISSNLAGFHNLLILSCVLHGGHHLSS